MEPAKVRFALTSDLHFGFTAKTILKHEKFFAKLALEKFSALLLAGDLISHQQTQLNSLFRVIRKHLPEAPIYACLGNHCHWDQKHYLKGRPDYKQLKIGHKNVFLQYGIEHVENGPHAVGDVGIVGYDGWYGHPNPPTNDLNFMKSVWEEGYPHSVLAKKADTDFLYVMDSDLSRFRKTVCVTHFPPFVGDYRYKDYVGNPRHYGPLREKFDVLCYGHTHRAEDFTDGRCRVLNSGSDYEKPQVVFFEV